MQLLTFPDIHPVILERGQRVLVEAPERVARGAEDELALLLGEVRAAADGDGEGEEAGAREARA
jgi:hypothetical protein